MDRQFDVLYAYLALARRPGQTARWTTAPVCSCASSAAERSGCRWCIDRARHDWRAAGLPVDLLRSLARHATSAGFSERDRAALALVDAVACAGAKRRRRRRRGARASAPPLFRARAGRADGLPRRTPPHRRRSSP